MVTQEVHTHVRLGASHGGDPHLLGQHGCNVEICDVHMPWGERKAQRMVSPLQPSCTITCLSHFRLEESGNLVCKSLYTSCNGVQAMKLIYFIPKVGMVLNQQLSSSHTFTDTSLIKTVVQPLEVLTSVKEFML